MNQRGMTLVEILIVIVLASVIGGLIVNMFVTSNRTFMDQERIVDVQRSGRVAMDTMIRLLREAGLDPLGSANAGVLEATATSVRFTRDANVNGAIDATNAETVEFEFVGDTLRRRFDGGPWVVMADKVTGVSLSYWDSSGTNIGIPGTDADELARIRSMVLTVSLQDDKTAGGDFVRSYTTGIYCRNL
jgi:prepilin-type N-terminal cleavage/methylation domain-containing protein